MEEYSIDIPTMDYIGIHKILNKIKTLVNFSFRMNKMKPFSPLWGGAMKKMAIFY